MQYPLKFSFTYLTLGSKITVTDAHDQLVFFVQRKAFKFKEDIRIYSDTNKTTEICAIKAQNWIDWSGVYDFSAPDGTPLGAVQRRGMRSIWKATYEIMRDGEVDYILKEENPFAKVMDNILGEIPILGIFTGLLFNPKYIILNEKGEIVMRLTKKSSITEGSFVLDKLQEFAASPEEEMRVLLGVFTAMILEKNRG